MQKYVEYVYVLYAEHIMQYNAVLIDEQINVPQYVPDKSYLIHFNMIFFLMVYGKSKVNLICFGPVRFVIYVLIMLII